MRHTTLNSFFTKARGLLSGSAPLAVVIIEDSAAIDATLDHCRKLGFAQIIMIGDANLLPRDGADLHLIEAPLANRPPVTGIINEVIEHSARRWIHYCYNGEFLHYPFCDTRTVSELAEFCTQERRDHVLGFVVDLYDADLDRFPATVSLEAAQLDRAGHYALARKTPDGKVYDRQLEFFGGLRWRFEQHIPKTRRRIDRPAVFKSTPGLRLLAEHRFNIEEYNTYTCPWHHSVTAAICSYRTAKALMSNPASADQITGLHWKNTVPFTWSAEQLMDLGFMEPGQWF